MRCFGCTILGKKQAFFYSHGPHLADSRIPCDPCIPSSCRYQCGHLNRALRGTCGHPGCARASCQVAAAFSYDLLVAGNSTDRNRQTQLVHTWLQGWCHWHSFVFLDRGMVYTTPGLLAPNSMHLSQRRKGVFVQELPGLITRTLNQIPRGKIDKTRPSWWTWWVIGWHDKIWGLCAREILQSGSGGAGYNEAPLKCCYTSARSMRSKWEEPEALAQSQSYNITGIREAWWEEPCDWCVAMDSSGFFSMDGQGRWGQGVAVCEEVAGLCRAGTWYVAAGDGMVGSL